MATPVTIYNAIPEIYDPRKQINQWVEVGENLVLPSGKSWSSGRDEYSIQQIMDKGCTHVKKQHLDYSTNPSQAATLMNTGKTFNEAPKNNEIFNMPGELSPGPNEWRTAPDGTRYNAMIWPNGPLNQAQAESKANQTDINHALWIGETCENDPWIDAGHPQWRHFYNIMRNRYDARFGSTPHWICHNYYLPSGRDWWTLGHAGPDRNIYKTKILRPFNQWEPTHFSPGGTLNRTNLIVDGIYIGAPDAQRKNVLRTIYKLMVFKAAGYAAGSVLFAIHEWRPNNYYNVEYPEAKFPGQWGTFYRQNKVALDPNEQMAYAFFSLLFGEIFADWGHGGRNSSTKMEGSWPNNDYWYSAGSSTDTGQEPAGQGGGYRAVGFPHYAFEGDGQKVRYVWSGGSDYTYFGVRMFAKTFGQTAGGTKKFCKFRINGGSWVTPGPNMADPIVDAYFDDGAFVISEIKDGKLALAFYKAISDNTKRVVEIEHPTNPAITYEFEICGNKVHSALITL